MIDGLEADVVTLALAYDIDAVAAHRPARPRTGRRGCRTTARPTPRPSSSWCARATPRGSRDWNDLVEAGRVGHHAQPQDLGRRALELPRGLGLRAAQLRQRPGQGQGLRRQAVQERAGPRHRRARLDHHLRRARHRRRAARLGERGAARRQGARGRQVRDRGAVAQHPGRAAGGGGRQGGRQARDAPPSPRPTSSTSTRPRARRSRPGTTTGRATPKVAAEVRGRSSPRSSCSPSTRRSAAGPKAQKTHFADGGIFDQIYQAGR